MKVREKRKGDCEKETNGGCKWRGWLKRPWKSANAALSNWKMWAASSAQHFHSLGASPARVNTCCVQSLGTGPAQRKKTCAAAEQDDCLELCESWQTQTVVNDFYCDAARWTKVPKVKHNPSLRSSNLKWLQSVLVFILSGVTTATSLQLKRRET